MKHWYLDAIDPRAGLALATCRKPDLFEEEPIAQDDPTVFLAPPAFEPEIVASRSVALAAGRTGGFQIGMIIAGSELPFSDLDALKEFVRRAYLRSGGGDAPDPDEGPPPTPIEGGPDLPLEPDLGTIETEGALDPVKELLDGAKRFQQAARELHPGQAERWTQWPSSAAAPRHHGGAPAASEIGAERLARAGSQLIVEMLRRLPLRGTEADMHEWRARARCLGWAIDRLGLWPLLAQRSRMTFTPRSLAESLHRQGHIQNDAMDYVTFLADHFDHESTFTFIIRDVLWDGRDLGGFPYYNYWRRYRYDHPAFWFIHIKNLVQRSAIPVVYDPSDCLDAIPIPRSVAFRMVSNEVEPDRATLHHLLVSAIGSPESLLAASSLENEFATELLLFAACQMVAEAARASIDGFGSMFQVDHFALNELIDEALVWLSRNLPQFVFAAEVEGAIGTANALAYRHEARAVA
jgi:hypothetical protein